MIEAKKSEGKKIYSFGNSNINLNATVIDAEYMMKLWSNPYILNSFGSLKHSMFIGVPQVTAYNKETNEIDEDRTNELAQQARNAGLYSSVQKAWSSQYPGGCEVISPGYIKEDKKYILSELRNLQWYSFGNSPQGKWREYNPVMRGIVANDNGETEVWQSDNVYGGGITKINNFVIIKDPMAPEPAGRGRVLPLISIIAKIDYTDRAEDQRINRVGAPSMMLKVNDDLESISDELNTYLNAIGARWGKDFSYVIPPGATLIDPHITESTSAKERLLYLAKLVDAFFNPASIFSKEGAIIGGSDTGMLEIYYNAINYDLSWLEEQYAPIFQKVLDLNGYKGHYVKITFPRPTINKSELMIKQAEVLGKYKAILPNELREAFSDFNLSQLDEEGKAKLAEVYAHNSFGNTTDLDNLSPGFGNAEVNKIITNTEDQLINLNETYAKKETDDLMKIYEQMYEQIPMEEK